MYRILATKNVSEIIMQVEMEVSEKIKHKSREKEEIEEETTTSGWKYKEKPGKRRVLFRSRS